MIYIESFEFGAFAENTYVLYDDTNKGIIIDPGCMEPYEEQQLKAFIDMKGIQIEKIVNTHCHIDHIFGNYFAKTTFEVPLYSPDGERELLERGAMQAQMWGMQGFQEVEADHYLPQEGTLTFGDSSLKILFVPGHSPGHLAFYSEAQSFLIGGDVLFHGSIGRTDLPGGDHQTLLNSIQTQFYVLPDNTRVYCGHGPTTTIGKEKVSNPFVKG
ncbi:MBL fold metallo-hydrolase [Algivirga pacifica]|uniref:MBL fold metallo-hydrolase n=1 Tax=Algivirga pacifica TaxID=1162670 RepID=A0ABP9DAR6_9BACT